MRSLVTLASACVWLTTVANSQVPAPEPFRLADAALELRISYDSQSLSGSAVYRLENWGRTPSSRVSFLLNRLMEASSVRDASGKSIPYSQDVVRFPDDPMRQVTQLVIHLPQPVFPGKSTILRIDYAGNLVGYTEVGWSYVRDRIDTAFTIIRQDALAFPTIGSTSTAANRRFPIPNFSYRVAVTVPQQYTVATGGNSTRTSNADGTTTWRYVSAGKSPFLNIAIAPFQTREESGVQIFYFPGDSVGARRLMSRTQTALHELTTWFGPLRDKLSLAVIEIPDGWGSQANLVGRIIQTAAAFKDPDRLGELYHELSHLWNSLDRDDPSPRWNEGLAMFVQDLLRERVDGWSGREQRHAQIIGAIRDEIAADSTYGLTPMIEYGAYGLSGRSYSVGRVMFATIYDIVGPERFHTIIAEYYRRFELGGTTRDFTALADQVSGGQLKPFFDDWMFSTKWTTAISSSKSVHDLAAPFKVRPTLDRPD